MLEVHALAGRCGWKLYTCSGVLGMYVATLRFANVCFQRRRILPVPLVSSLVPIRCLGL